MLKRISAIFNLIRETSMDDVIDKWHGFTLPFQIKARYYLRKFQGLPFDSQLLYLASKHGCTEVLKGIYEKTGPEITINDINPEIVLQTTTLHRAAQNGH